MKYFFWAVFFSVAIFYVGGWSILFGADLNQFNLLLNGELVLGKDLLFGGRYVAISFNSQYYGLILENRFFDSPILSYMAFGAGVLAAYEAIKAAFSDNYFEEEIEEETEKG